MDLTNLLATTILGFLFFEAMKRIPLGSAKQMNTSMLTGKFKEIFKTYDKRIIPSKDGHPLNISMQLFILDMIPTKSYHMHYDVNLFVRQVWRDYRLDISVGELSWNAFGIEAVRDIWLPEIHFPEAKQGKWLSLMKPNTAFHLRENGSILLSRRVLLTVYCPMNLRNFPFDEQTCKMDIRFYAYNNKHCRLSWYYDRGGPIFVNKDLKISAFSLKSISHDERVVDLNGADKYDTLSVTFVLERKISYYLVHHMLPCAMIVVLSWVGFWIDYRATPARASLAITTVLTITSLTNSIRMSLPNVAYTKSIDVYLLTCFFFVFASTVEFAVAGVTDKKWLKSHKKRKSRAEANKRRENERIEVQETALQSDLEINAGTPRRADDIVSDSDVNQISMMTIENGNALKTTGIHRRKKLTINQTNKGEKPSGKDGRRLGSFRKQWRALVNKLIDKHMKMRSEVHIIDKLSRRLFPILFMIFNSLFFAAVFLRR